MSKIVATLAVLMLAFAASASAAPPRDFRSPDARPATVSQDYRSPDARPVSVQPASQDLRSPDALPAGRFQPSASAGTPHPSSSFNWGYLAILVTIPLLLLLGYVVTVRRGREHVAIGS